MNGIGGFTIKEARKNLTLEEFQTWKLFRAKYGPLNLFHRIDYAFARDLAYNKGGKVIDYMPYLANVNTQSENLLNNFAVLPSKNNGNINIEERKMKMTKKTKKDTLEKRKERLESFLNGKSLTVNK